MGRKKLTLVIVTTLAMLIALIPAVAATPVQDEVGLFDTGQGRWHLRDGVVADLTGAAEVPGPGDANAVGKAFVNLDATGGWVCFSIDHSAIDGTVTAAHIHRGAAGVAGGIEVSLDYPTNGDEGCVAALPSLIDEINANKGGFYVNVHSTAFPGGAIRGQLKNGTVTSFYFGNPSDVPFMGDWDGDGVDTPGLYRPSDGFVYLRNSNTTGVADVSYFFGNANDVPLAGDFNGDGFDTVSLYRPSEQKFYISNKLGPKGGSLGPAEFSFAFGNPGDEPIVGDWDGDGTDTIGVRRPSTAQILQRNSNSSGPADTTLIFGDPGDAFVTGDWDGNPTDTPGVFRSPDGKFFQRNTNTTGIANTSFFFGNGGWVPLAGQRVPRSPVALQILAINDFHGNINTSSSSFGGTGGADYLAANLKAAQTGAKNSIFVSAGDLIGASPLISALFHDEPTIEAMNLLGLAINGVGNHEFDEGKAELLRMQYGGTHPVDGNLDGTPFLGAAFQFLAANVLDNATSKTIFPPYTIRNYEGVNVAFIGLTLEGTPTIVTPSGVAGMTFKDEAETVNALVSELQKKSIQAIVILLHEGGASPGGQNDCIGGLTGPVAEIVPKFDKAVDLVVTGHTNDEFICEIDGKWVTMADNAGRLFTDIDVLLDPTTKDMTVVSAVNLPNLRSGVTPDAGLKALIDKYDALSAPLANTVIGTITADITRTINTAGESALGDVIADAQLAATASAGTGNAVVAFMNPGGIRADLLFAPSGAEAAGAVTYGEAFGVQPFGNSLVTMTLTGAQIDTLLEQQFDNPTVGSNRILQVSNGFTYSWSLGAPTGSKVDPASIMIGGVTVDPSASYRVTVNSFLADGGDNFTVLIAGTGRLGGEVDLDALVTYFGANSPVAPGPQNRFVQLP